MIAMAEAGKSADEVFRAVDERWGIEYPATNNAVLNGGIVATAVWFGEGDFNRTLQLAVHAADFADTDCNSANSESVVAAIHLVHGASDDGNSLRIAIQKPVTQPAELFKLADLMQYWNPDWTLARAGFGGAGGGLPGIRGITYLDGDTLATYPRDEIRGVVLRRAATLGEHPHLSFQAGVDPGRAWQLQVYVNDQRILDELVDGTADSKWRNINLDLAAFRDQNVTLRLYQLVLISHHEAGNAYWRDLVLSK